MKKVGVLFCFLITAVFLCFALGFNIGTNKDSEYITVSGGLTPGDSLTFDETTAPTEKLPQESSGKVNINTADVQVLTTLPGITPVLAQKIVDYRQEHGPFTAVLQLLHVDGITEDIMYSCMNHVTIGG